MFPELVVSFGRIGILRPCVGQEMRADGISALNASLAKKFYFTERVNLALRLEAFNAPNRPAFDTPKPERLLRRIIHIATDPGDLVLDCFVGSGTSAAVAQNRSAEREYTFDGPTGRSRGLERAFVVGGRAFVLQWRAPQTDWPAWFHQCFQPSVHWLTGT